MARYKNKKKKKGKSKNVPPTNPQNRNDGTGPYPKPVHTMTTHRHSDSNDMDWEPTWALNWRKTVDREVDMLDAPDALDYALAQLLGVHIEPKDPKVSGPAWDYALDRLLGPYWIPVVW